MGFFDLAAPVLGAADGILAVVLPPFLRLCLWGILAGWLTMLAYRKLSNQQKITSLKNQQKDQQKAIIDFDGEISELMPLVGKALGLGFRQLGLAIGPALLASVPILFLVAWIAGSFGYAPAQPGNTVQLTPVPTGADLVFVPPQAARRAQDHWELNWPNSGERVSIISAGEEVLQLPTKAKVPVIHKKQWWNSLFANPIGYLPDKGEMEQLEIGLPEKTYLPFGPAWMRGWMFWFFTVFLVSSLGFKFLLKID